MSYGITNRCIHCDSCLPLCPTGAIKTENEGYWIEPKQCNSCQGHYPEPQCVVSCPVNSPVPLRALKGRCKAGIRTATSPDLFPDKKSHPFASALVSWELCNILAQRQSLPWETDASGHLCYRRPVNHGQGLITFRITETLDSDPSLALGSIAARAAIEALDIRAACLHLIYAAHAMALERPWQQEFIVSDQQIARYLGLEKRKDLNKIDKLSLIKELAQQPCRLQVSIRWPQQGKVQAFSLEADRLWHLLDVQHHFQEDEDGCKHLVGLTFRVRAGRWAQHFLNLQGYRERTAYYQYSSLPSSVLSAVMSIWQQHEGAARMLLWLLFRMRIGRKQRITVPALMHIAYGKEKLSRRSAQRKGRKRLLQVFESDLEVLSHYGLKPIFDPTTYPAEIQPLWAKLADLPEDAEDALDFWITDGSHERRLTDPAPRGKWNRLMQARILRFELPEEWEKELAKHEHHKQQNNGRKSSAKLRPAQLGTQIAAARQHLRLSQRALANRIGKSQSWIRDVENDRFQVKAKDQALLHQELGITNIS